MLRLVLSLGFGSTTQGDFVESQVLLTLSGDSILTQSGLYILQNSTVQDPE
jgi:hypothetical protein